MNLNDVELQLTINEWSCRVHPWDLRKKVHLHRL